MRTDRVLPAGRKEGMRAAREGFGGVREGFVGGDGRGEEGGEFHDDDDDDDDDWR